MLLDTVSPRPWTIYQIWTLTEEEEGHFAGAGNVVASLYYDYLGKFGYADGRELPATPDPNPGGLICSMTAEPFMAAKETAIGTVS